MKQIMRFIGICSIILIAIFFTGVTSAQETNEVPLDTVWASDFGDMTTEQFAFSSVDGAMTTVVIRNVGGSSGIIANLREADSFNTVSSMNVSVGMAIFCVPAGQKDYIITLDRNIMGEAQAYEALITQQPTSFCSPNVIETVLEDTEAPASAENNGDANVDSSAVSIPFEVPVESVELPVVLSADMEDNSDADNNSEANNSDNSESDDDADNNDNVESDDNDNNNDNDESDNDNNSDNASDTDDSSDETNSVSRNILEVDVTVDAADDFPSILIDTLADDGTILTVDVNVFADDEALVGVDAFQSNMMAVYVYEDENGDLAIDVVLGDDSGVNIADNLPINEIGLDVMVDLSEEGLLVDALANDTGFISAEVADSEAVISLRDEAIVTVSDDNMLSDSVSVSDIELPVDLGLDGLVLDVSVDEAGDGLSLTGTLDNGTDNLLLVDVNVLVDDEALVDADVLGDDLIAVYVYEDENGDLAIDVVLGDDSGITVADNLDLGDLGLDVMVDLSEEGLLVDVLANDTGFISAEIVDSEAVISLRDEAIVTVSDDNMLSDSVSVSDIELPVDLGLDGLVLDVSVDEAGDGLSLTGTLDDGTDNLLLVDVNVLVDDEALVDADVLGDDLIAVYVYEDENGDLAIDVVLGDDSGVSVADNLDLGDLGLDVMVDLNHDGLLVDVLANDTGIISADVSETGLVVALFEDEFVVVDETSIDITDVSNTVSFSDASCTANPNTRFDTINIRTLPSTAAAPLAVIASDSDLGIIGEALNDTWLQVVLPDGRTGFAAASILSLAEVCATVELPIVDVNTAEISALEASVEVDTAVGVDVNADASVGEDGVAVDATVGGTDVDVNVGGDGVDVNVGGDGGVDVNVPVDPPVVPTVEPPTVPPLGG